MMARLIAALIVVFGGVAMAQENQAAQREQAAREQEGRERAQRDQAQRDQAQRAQQPQANQPQANQPQRGFGNRGFGFFGQRRPDVFAETLAALGDLALAPDFMITTEQKESIQSLRGDHKLASDKWRGENADELLKMSEDMAAARESGNQQMFQELLQKQRDFFQKAPRAEDAAKKLVGLLNEEQRRRLDEKLAERRAEAEVQRQLAGGR